MKKVSIVIPAHNEEQRIGRTLHYYYDYFNELLQEHERDFELVVVLNGCTDNTLGVVQDFAQNKNKIVIVNLKEAGKGLAIIAGFKDALTRSNDLIGFVDADMATSPNEYDELIRNIGNYDGIIASRYISGSTVVPARPWWKRWGSKITYEPLIFLLFGMHYYDFQCGAKLFTRKVIQTVTPQLSIGQWAIDVELLYLCKKNGFKVKEIKTVWHDQEGSKLNIRAGLRMLGALFKLRLIHSPFKFLIK